MGGFSRNPESKCYFYRAVGKYHFTVGDGTNEILRAGVFGKNVPYLTFPVVLALVHSCSMRGCLAWHFCEIWVATSPACTTMVERTLSYLINSQKLMQTIVCNPHLPNSANCHQTALTVVPELHVLVAVLWLVKLYHLHLPLGWGRRPTPATTLP